MAFFTVLFSRLLDVTDQVEIDSLFSNLRDDLREGLQIFFDRFVKKSDLNVKKSKWRTNFKLACKVLGRIKKEPEYDNDNVNANEEDGMFW